MASKIADLQKLLTPGHAPWIYHKDQSSLSKTLSYYPSKKSLLGRISTPLSVKYILSVACKVFLFYWISPILNIKMYCILSLTAFQQLRTILLYFLLNPNRDKKYIFIRRRFVSTCFVIYMPKNNKSKNYQHAIVSVL